MALETSTYINELVVTNPVDSTDQVASLGGHVRLLKAAIKATFPNVSGAVNLTHQELNYLVGVTSSLQSQLNAKAASTDVTAAVAAHAALADPHPGYVTTAEGAALISVHEAASDPHPGYVTTAELAAVVTFGVGQTWQNVLGSRALSTSYRNETGNSIMVSVRQAGGEHELLVSVDDSTWVTVCGGYHNEGYAVVVPDDHYYKVTGSALEIWAELR